MWQPMMRRSALAVLLGAACAAHAADQPIDPPASIRWSFVPAAPTTRDLVYLRNVFSGCDSGGRSADSVSFDPATGFVDLYMAYGSDVCDTWVVDDVTNIRLGYFPAGTYTVRFISCGMPFDPDATCNETSRPRMSFSVTEAGLPHHVVPTLGDAVKLALAAVLAAAGLAFVRVRR